MADIFPFKGWIFNKYSGRNIAEYLSPSPEDSEKEKILDLYNNPINSIHLAYPRENHLHNLLSKLEYLKDKNIIKKAPNPCLYVFYQEYLHPEDNSKCNRTGFISHVKLYDWKDKVVLKHENIINRNVDEKVNLLKETGLQMNPTIGVYYEESEQLNIIMAQALNNPVWDALVDNLTFKLAVIEDEETILKFVNTLKDKEIYLMDGHHRYNALLRINKESNNNVLHPMFLINGIMENPYILPFHRLIKSEGITSEEFISAIKIYFDVFEIIDDSGENIKEQIKGKKYRYGLVLKEGSFIIDLKEEYREKVDWPFPLEINNLELTVIHYYIIEKILKIKGKHQKDSPHIKYFTKFTEGLKEIRDYNMSIGIIVNPISMNEITKVAKSGYTLPQKATYFYPKLPNGLVLSPITLK